MKVAVLCEFSGVVRDAFIRRGCKAISCDVRSTGSPGPHIQGYCQHYDWSKYDLVICHPPCTHLAVSGSRWFAKKKRQQEASLRFVKYLLNLPVERLCLENPISVISTRIRKPDQIIQPWMFGHGETKATCLWLSNLPLLQPTRIVEGRFPAIHLEPPSEYRELIRSRTYKGIAEAMAEQWGSL